MAELKALPYAPLRITSLYGKRSAPTPGATTWHSGIDIGRDRSKYRGSDGGPVMAAAAGAVSSSFYSKSRGWVVMIDHGGGIKTLYQHLLTQGIKAGKKVAAGQEIGRMGSSGISSGVHLHFEVLVDGVNVDPLPLLMMIAENGKMMENMENIYKTMTDVPTWCRPAISAMVDMGGITPAADGSINITESMARIYTSFHKIGLLDAAKAIRSAGRG